MRYTAPQTSIDERILRSVESFVSFSLASMTTFALAMNVAFNNVFPSTRIAMVIAALLLVHVLYRPRILFSRESALYAVFLAYMFVQILWTDDTLLALNTLVPAVTFFLILILFSSLVSMYGFHAVLVGLFTGFALAAGIYTAAAGFPFIYPRDFSYNAIAGMYLFGLFCTLLLSCYRGPKGLLLLAGLVILSLNVATTSIKTNLGIVFGVAAASLIYFKQFRDMVARNILLIVVSMILVGVAIASNDAVLESLERGLQRIALAVDVLQAREDLPGFSGIGKRSAWAIEGFRGSIQNPVFGYGVEAFRSRYGTTSHATPVDLLYNSGLIGLVLFYSIFLSLMWRLRSINQASARAICALIFASMVCYLSITLSATMHYNTFLAAFIGISVGLLKRQRWQDKAPVLKSRAW